MNKGAIFGGLVLFMLGFFASSVLPVENIVDNMRYPFSAVNTKEIVFSPSDSIDQDNIHLFKQKLVIEEEGLIYASIKDTHSMEPVLNTHSTSIEKKPTTPDVLAVGDIISYSLDSKIIIHRIVEIGEDNLGWYATTKGDNNENYDKEKVRFSQIEGLVVGIIY